MSNGAQPRAEGFYGILLEDGADFLLLEDGTDFLVQESDSQAGVILPPAASRSPYNHLTIRNLKTTDRIQVHAYGNDAIEGVVGGDNWINPTEGFTLQSNGVDGWFAVSNVSTRKMHWRSAWNQGSTYFTEEVVRDGEWVMIANKQTNQRPAPLPDYDNVQEEYPDVPPWPDSGSELTSFYISGQKYTFNQAGFIQSYRVWCPNQANTEYQTIIIDYTDPAHPVVTPGDTLPDNSSGWVTVPTGLFLVTDVSVLGVYLRSQNRTASSSFTWSYEYLSPQNVGTPAAGEIFHPDKDTTQLYCNPTSNGGTLNDAQADWLSLNIGDEVTGAGRTWTVTSTPVTEVDGTISFGVNPTIQGTVGIGDFVGTVYGQQPVDYVMEANKWVGHDDTYYSVNGVYRLGEDTAATENQNGFGADISFLPAEISEDWDLVARSYL